MMDIEMYGALAVLGIGVAVWGIKSISRLWLMARLPLTN